MVERLVLMASLARARSYVDLLLTFGDALDRLHGITAPTLVLVGAEDILTPPEYSRAMAARIPGARLQVLERGGHGVPLEYPPAVNEVLPAFLAKPAPVTAS